MIAYIHRQLEMTGAHSVRARIELCAPPSREIPSILNNCEIYDVDATGIAVGFMDEHFMLPWHTIRQMRIEHD